jgi:hypothetical protein
MYRKPLYLCDLLPDLGIDRNADSKIFLANLQDLLSGISDRFRWIDGRCPL